MLETLWYMLILVVQVVQANPQIQTDKMQIDVYVASKNAYSFTIQGSAVQGQIVNAETRKIFGEFESTRRLPQTYVIFPREALPEELVAALKSSTEKGGGTSAATKPGDKTKDSPVKELVPLTIDYTKVLKQLVSFKVKSRQTIEFTEKERFLGNAQDAQSTKAKPSATPAVSKTASPAPGTSTLPVASPSSVEADKKSLIEIRQYSNRLVLTADFAQLVIIVNFM